MQIAVYEAVSTGNVKLVAVILKMPVLIACGQNGLQSAVGRYSACGICDELCVIWFEMILCRKCSDAFCVSSLLGPLIKLFDMCIDIKDENVNYGRVEQYHNC